MENCRNAAGALVLALALSTSAFAGEMHTGITQPPPPTANGEMQTGVTQPDEGESTPGADTLTKIMLNLLQSLLTLL